MGVRPVSLGAQRRPAEQLAMDGEAGCHHRDVCAPYSNQNDNVEAYPMGWVALVD